MNIILLQSASGSEIVGPKVRVPPGNYDIEKIGEYDRCDMILNDDHKFDLNSCVVLSNFSSVRLLVQEAKNLTVRFVKND